MANKITIIDGNSLLFRAYFATAYPGASLMMSKDGTPTNAIFAFANMILKILNSMKEGEGLFVAFDTDKQTFRKQQLETYKANRKPTPQELIVQFPLAREFLNALGICFFELHGYEADDIAGTIAKLAEKENYDVNIYTSDRDYLQLVSNNIKVSIIKKGLSDIMIMTPENVEEIYGFKPLQVIDYKGLRGDPSDNLPGIPGVGEKTAIKLIQDYGDFDHIVEAAKQMKSKVGQSIVENQQTGRLCRQLAIIDTNVPLDIKVSDTIYQGYDFLQISKFAQKYELKQFMNKLPSRWKKTNPFEKEIIIEEISSFKNIDVGNQIGIALDFDNDDYYDCQIYGASIFANSHHYYINFEDMIKDQYFKSIIQDERIDKCCFFAKAIEVALAKHKITLNGVNFDLLIAAYVLDSNLSTTSPDAVMAMFGVDITTNQDDVSLLDMRSLKKTSLIAMACLLIKPKAIKELDNIDSLKLYQEIELPLSSVLAQMEYEGFPLNKKVLDEFGDEFKTKVAILEKDIYQLAGAEFNISSPKQMGEILFNKMGIPNLKGGSTSIEVLKELTNVHPIINKIIEYRKYSKLVSTYTDGLKVHIRNDGKIHAIFNQAQTATGRLSSSHPNLQNISIRDEEGKMIRKAFFYEDGGFEILSLDYSQIELRILASLSNCQKMIDIFKHHQDIHSATAKLIFNCSGEPSESQRRKAKAVNFGIVYGISDWGLAEQISVPIKQAKEIIDNFYNTFPEIAQFLKEIVLSAQKNGYVSTLFGRRRYLREIYDTNYQKREFAKRAAMNAPIQGTAADLIKIVMVKISRWLSQNNLKTKLVSQIHDELIFKVAKNEKEIVYQNIINMMQNAVNLNVPLEVNGGFGKTWYDAK